MSVVKPKKVGLILGGGGFRGYCHVCVLKWLEDNNIPIDALYGNSVGAIIGASFIAEGCKTKQLFRTFASIKESSDVFEFQSALYFIWYLGIPPVVYKPDGLVKLIAKINMEKLFTKPQEFIAVVTHIPSGKVRYLSTKSPEWLENQADFPLGIQASASPIGVFPFVVLKRNGEYEVYADGGYKRPLPIKKAIEDGCDTIIVSRCHSDHIQELILDIWKRRFPHRMMYANGLLHNTVEKDEITRARRDYPNVNLFVAGPEWFPRTLRMDSFRLGDFEKTELRYMPIIEQQLAPLRDYFQNKRTPPTNS